MGKAGACAGKEGADGEAAPSALNRRAREEEGALRARTQNDTLRRAPNRRGERYWACQTGLVKTPLAAGDELL